VTLLVIKMIGKAQVAFFSS
jgi:hypothetical protein